MSDSLKEIGKALKIEKYSTVSSIIERVKKEIPRDNIFKKRVDHLIVKVVKSQRQT
jgi:chromosomal replication initiation ATPase DnaA